MNKFPKLRTIAPGEFVLVSSGAYSDYAIACLLRATAPLDLDAARDDWLTENPEQAEPYGFDGDKFLAWLVKTRPVELVPAVEFYMHEYGEIDGMRIIEPSPPPGGET